jgi:hypothetical protein
MGKYKGHAKWEVGMAISVRDAALAGQCLMIKYILKCRSRFLTETLSCRI